MATAVRNASAPPFSIPHMVPSQGLSASSRFPFVFTKNTLPASSRYGILCGKGACHACHFCPRAQQPGSTARSPLLRGLGSLGPLGGQDVYKRQVEDMNKSYFPVKTIIPSTEIVHDRVMLELFRGCIRG